MKKIIYIFLLLFVFCFLYAGNNKNSIESTVCLPFFRLNSSETLVRIASYNLRYKAVQDIKTGNEWNKRKYYIAKIIRDYNLEIVGTQEGDFNQMDDLLSLLPGYDYIGYPYKDSLHTASILFKESRFEVMDKGQFWYSETPDIESIGWDATDSRICTWARIKDKQNDIQFYFFNSHFYWRLHTARENSGKVMVNKIKEIVSTDLPVISLGDFNSIPTSPQIDDIKTLLQSAYDVSESPTDGPEGTAYKKFKYDIENPGKRIDYVFINKKVRVLTYSVLDYTYDDGRFPSDHLPIVCDLIIEDDNLK
jgi:endonuclease/exonuclease/phosphatase family metal-dependent hydrolase